MTVNILLKVNNSGYHGQMTLLPSIFGEIYKGAINTLYVPCVCVYMYHFTTNRKGKARRKKEERARTSISGIRIGNQRLESEPTRDKEQE